MISFLFVILMGFARGDFAVIGDWGRGGTAGQRRVAEALRREAPDFVVSTGDNFYSVGIESANEGRTHEWVDVYNASVPWYVCLGNHDYLGNAAAQVDMTRVYNHWYMPDRFYNVRHGDVELFVMDTTPWEPVNYVVRHFGSRVRHWEDLDAQMRRVPEQTAWLTSALAASTAPRKFIVGHHPLWTYGWHANAPVAMKDVVTRLMREHGVEAYLCGHDHNLQHIVSDEGVEQYLSGAGSSRYPLRKKVDDRLRFASTERGFLMVRDDGTYDFIGENGATLS